MFYLVHEAFLKNLQDHSAPTTGHATFKASIFPSAGCAWDHAPMRGGSSPGSRAARGGRFGGRRGGRFGGQFMVGAGRGRLQCTWCDLPGHYAATCYEMLSHTGSQGPAYRTDSTHLAEHFQSSLQLEPTARSSDWFVDSGATNHMAFSASSLESVSPYSV